MNNRKLTNIILILLLIFNVGFLGSWWYGHWKAHHKYRHEMFGHLAKGGSFFCSELNFEQSQLVQYEALRKIHLQKMKSLETSETQYDLNMMSIVTQNPSDSVRANMYADSVGMVKALTMKEIFRHLSDVKKMCNPEQHIKFEEIMKRMTEEFPYYHKDYHAGKESIDTNSN